MPQATGYVLLAPPQVTLNATSILVAALVGGDVLDSTLTINPDAGPSVTFDGPIPIRPGETWGSARFRATGTSGSFTLSATHSGDNAGMGDPGPSSLSVLPALTALPTSATSWTCEVISPPPAYSVPSEAHPFARTGRVGQTQALLVRLGPGTVLSVPLMVSFSDDAGGEFVNNPVTLSGSPGPGYALVGYRPMAAGVRTITVSATGGGGIVHEPAGIPELSTALEFIALP